MIIKPLLIFLLLSCCLPPVLGQSLPSPKDTTYVFKLIEKGKTLENEQVEAALITYRKAFGFAEKINYERGYYDGIKSSSSLLNRHGRYEESKKSVEIALKKAKADQSEVGFSICYFMLAQTALYQGDYDEAIPNYQRAAHYMRRLGKMSNVAVIDQNLGVIYDEREMYPKAIEFYKKALVIHNRDSLNRRNIANDYFSIANAYHNQGDIRTAQTYFEKVKSYVDPEKDADLLTRLYVNLGLQHIEFDPPNYDSSLYYIRKGLQLSRRVGNIRDEQAALMSLAHVYNRTGKYPAARRALDQAHIIATENELGLTELRGIYEEYRAVYEGLGDYKTALAWDTKLDHTDSLIVSEQTKEMLQEYEVKLKKAESHQVLAEKQRKIDRLEEERGRQRLWLLIAVLSTAVIGTVLVLGYLYYRQRQRTTQNALLAAQREGELAVAQSELDGQRKERHRISKEMHDDLGASLTAIGLLSEVAKRKMGPETTPEIEKISSISAEMVTAMNEIIWSLNTRNDSLNGLIAYTRSYASEFVDNTGLTLRTDVAESPYEMPMRGPDRRNVFLTVKEALNNVAKHAQATEVRLTIRPEADCLFIEVNDDGRGFAENSAASTRNGLGNMRGRMVEAGGFCKISSLKQGTRVEISYPYPHVPKAKIISVGVRNG